MQNNFITKLSPSAKLIICFLLILTTLLAKSIYLILFIITLTIILLIISNKRVNVYVNSLKKVILLLIIFLVAYIIILKQYNIESIFLFAYKLINIFIFVKILFLNINFMSLHEGLYGIFLPLKKFKLDIEKITLEITLAAWFIKFLLESKKEIKQMQKIKSKRIINIKHYVLPILICSSNKLETFQNSLKIQFYKLKYTKMNFKSKMLLTIFSLIFILCLIKEVIL